MTPTISVTWSATTFELELSELDDLSIVHVDVCFGRSVLGDDTIEVLEPLFQLSSPSYVVSMHVSVNCKRNYANSYPSVVHQPKPINSTNNTSIHPATNHSIYSSVSQTVGRRPRSGSQSSVKTSGSP